VVEGSGFENRRTERYQGFESLLLRYFSRGILMARGAAMRRDETLRDVKSRS
jgi:hypothetical protein